MCTISNLQTKRTYTNRFRLVSNELRPCLFITIVKHVWCGLSPLLSNQVKRTPQEPINEFIIQKLNPLLVVDFRLISAFLNV